MQHLTQSLRHLIVLSLISMLLLPFGNSIHAQTNTGIIRVAPNGSDTPGCGSESSPCQSPLFGAYQAIQSATFTVSGEVRIAGGRYSQSAFSSLVHVGNAGNLRISGGYSTSNWNGSDPINNATILDGQNTKRGIFISVPNDKAAACHITISNLTIENGRSNNDIGNTYGGGILIDNCTDVRISNVTIRNSQAVGLSNTGNSIAAAGAGGAIAVRGNQSVQAGLTLQNVILSSNQALGGNEASAIRGGLGVGGAIFSESSKLNFTNVTLIDNIARAGDAPGGSGNEGGQRADGLGGGLAIIRSPSFTINGLTIRGNKAEGGDANGLAGLALGGGLFIELSSGSISNATIQGNQASGGASSSANGTGGTSLGGSMHVTDSTVILSQVAMIQNTVNAGTGATSGDAGGGGASFVRDNMPTSITADNLIIGANTATAGAGGLIIGGGLHCSTVQLNLRHATIANNTLNGNGAKLGSAMSIIGLSAGNGCSGSISNSIIANHAGSPIYANPNAGQTTFNTTLSANNGTPFLDNSGNGSVSETNTFPGDPRFVNAINGDFHIGAGSAALDKASATSLTADIDGQKRPIGAAADLGADELQLLLNASASDTSISLSWQVPAGTAPTHYEIEYTKDPGVSDPQQGASPIRVGTQTSFALTGLTKNKTYSIKVVAYNGSTRLAESDFIPLFTGEFRAYMPVVTGSQ